MNLLAVFRRTARRAAVTGLRPLSAVNAVLPKRADRIVIYDNLGFHDNCQGLYEYLLAAGLNRRYRIICATPAWRDHAASAPPGVRFVPTWFGLAYWLTSRYVFYAFGKIPLTPSSRQIVVNMWHGMGFKPVGNRERPGSVPARYFTKMLVTSPVFAPVMAESFACAEPDLLVCNQPRTDALFCPAIVPGLPPHKHLVAWLPTFRTSTIHGWADSTRDVQLPLFDAADPATPHLLAQLNDWLGAHDTVLLVKFHPLQKLGTWPDFSHLVFYAQQRLEQVGVGLYNLLGACDALITDFSSVYIDYLLLDRPIGFAFDDIGEYRRGFTVDDPTEFMPGPHIGDVSQLRTFIESLDGDDPYSARRRALNDQFNSFQDAHAAQRLLALVGIGAMPS